MSKASRGLKYMWHKLHEKGAKFDHEAAQSVINRTLEYDSNQPHGSRLKKAVIVEEVYDNLCFPSLNLLSSCVLFLMLRGLKGHSAPEQAHSRRPCIP